jgi:hypothetical protein
MRSFPEGVKYLFKLILKLVLDLYVVPHSINV